MTVRHNNARGGDLTQRQSGCGDHWVDQSHPLLGIAFQAEKEEGYHATIKSLRLGVYRRLRTLRSASVIEYGMIAKAKAQRRPQFTKAKPNFATCDLSHCEGTPILTVQCCRVDWHYGRLPLSKMHRSNVGRHSVGAGTVFISLFERASAYQVR
jgi:hypothetical protein